MAAITLTDDNFNNEVLQSEIPVIVDFWASWCGPCKFLSPIIDEISDEQDDIKICKVNVDEQSELAARFGVLSIPKLIVFKDGKEVTSSLGVISKSEILDLVK